MGRLLLLAVRDARGEVCRVAAFARDITEERRGQREREITLALLRLLNDGSRTRELIHNVTAVLHQWMGCEAVGVRLREGDDFPYYETCGFPAEFVEAENSLCAAAPRARCCARPTAPVLGVSVRQSPGRPLRREFVVLYAARQFLDQQQQHVGLRRGTGATGTAARPLPARRLRIPGGLIPLRHGGQVLGLLQLNDRARGQFSPELIVFLENMADQLAVALAQREAQAALRESEERFRLTFDQSPIGKAIVALDGRYLRVNDALCDITGYSAGELTAMTFADITHPEDLAADLCRCSASSAATSSDTTGRSAISTKTATSCGFIFACNC